MEHLDSSVIIILIIIIIGSLARYRNAIFKLPTAIKDKPLFDFAKWSAKKWGTFVATLSLYSFLLYGICKIFPHFWGVWTYETDSFYYSQFRMVLAIYLFFAFNKGASILIPIISFIIFTAITINTINNNWYYNFPKQGEQARQYLQPKDAEKEYGQQQIEEKIKEEDARRNEKERKRKENRQRQQEKKEEYTKFQNPLTDTRTESDNNNGNSSKPEIKNDYQRPPKVIKFDTIFIIPARSSVVYDVPKGWYFSRGDAKSRGAYLKVTLGNKYYYYIDERNGIKKDTLLERTMFNENIYNTFIYKNLTDQDIEYIITLKPYSELR